MVLAPLTTPAHFTGRRSGPPVKAQVAPPSPTAASPHSRLRAWRGKSFSEDTAASPGVHRSIFSLNAKELAAMFLEAPAEQSGKKEEKEEKETTGSQESNDVLLRLQNSWNQVWSNSAPEGPPGTEENRYVVVDDLEGHHQMEEHVQGGEEEVIDGENIAAVAQELIEDGGLGLRHRKRFAAVVATAGAGLLSLILFNTVRPKKLAI